MHKKWMLALLVASVFGGSAAVASDHKCTLTKLASVELRAPQDDYVLIPVKLHEDSQH